MKNFVMCPACGNFGKFYAPIDTEITKPIVNSAGQIIGSIAENGTEYRNYLPRITDDTGRWTCPVCGHQGVWDWTDENFEKGYRIVRKSNYGDFYEVIENHYGKACTTTEFKAKVTEMKDKFNRGLLVDECGEEYASIWFKLFGAEEPVIIDGEIDDLP